MNRRTYLASVSAVAVGLAGCTSSDSDPEPTPEETETETQTEEPDTETETETETEAPEPTEEETEEQTEEGPTDEELASNHLDDAHTSLRKAVDEFVMQAHPFDDFGALDASHSTFESGPITRHLTDVHQTLEEASDYATKDQRKTIQALQRGAQFIRAVIDAHPGLHEVYTETVDLVEAYVSGDDEAEIQGQRETVSDAIDSHEDAMDDLEKAVMILESQEYDRIKAFDWEHVEAHQTAFDADYSAAATITTLVDDLLEADELFATEEYDTAEGIYEGVVDGASHRSEVLTSELEYFGCYAEAMVDASYHRHWQDAHSRTGNVNESDDHRQKAEDAEERAADCSYN